MIQTLIIKLALSIFLAPLQYFSKTFDFDVVFRYGLAIRAYDANGNVATPSNVATLVFPIQISVEPTTGPTMEPTTVEPTTIGSEEIIIPVVIVEPESLPAAVLVVIVISAVSVVAISFAIFLYFYHKKHRGDGYKTKD